MTAESITHTSRKFRLLITALVMLIVGILAAPSATAQEEEPEKKPPVVSLGNEDVKEAPPINVVRERPKQPGEIEDAEGEEAPEGEEEEEAEKEEEKIIDSFVKLQGNGRYHLADCALVKRSRRAKQSLNGAKVIEMRLYACSVCKPPAPVKNPPKPKPAEGEGAEGAEGEGSENTTAEEGEEMPERRGSSLAPRGRKEPEVTEDSEDESEGGEEGSGTSEDEPADDDDEDDEEDER